MKENFKIGIQFFSQNILKLFKAVFNSHRANPHADFSPHLMDSFHCLHKYVPDILFFFSIFNQKLIFLSFMINYGFLGGGQDRHCGLQNPADQLYSV